MVDNTDSHSERSDATTTKREAVRQFLASNFSYASLRIVYFVLLSFTGATLIFFFEDGDCGYVDALFMSFSAMTNTGLITVNSADWSVRSQVVVVVLIFAGGQVLMTAMPVMIRRQFFRKGYLEQRGDCKGHRDEAEYQALGIMKRVVLWIFVGTQASAALVIGLYVTFNAKNRRILDENNVNSWWFGVFHGISAFNNAGMTLLDDNLTQFRRDRFLLLVTCLLILLGNTAFPVLLYTTMHLQQWRKPTNAGYRFLLKHPRRCSTHLFSLLHTQCIAGFVVLFTGLMLVVFVCLRHKLALEGESTNTQILAGFFQAVSTRTAGFNVIDISLLAPATQVMYCIMMYVSSYPVISAIRSVSAIPNSKRNDDDADDITTMEPGSLAPASVSVIVGQMKATILADSGLLVTALFAICVAEGDKIADSGAFSVFSTLFEITSAYGTVGLSLGYPGTVTSLSGRFSTFSKLVMIIVMLAARQRGLPRSIDSSVHLPRLLNVTQSQKGGVLFSILAGHVRRMASMRSRSRADSEPQLQHPTFTPVNFNLTRMRSDTDIAAIELAAVKPTSSRLKGTARLQPSRLNINHPGSPIPTPSSPMIAPETGKAHTQKHFLVLRPNSHNPHQASTTSTTTTATTTNPQTTTTNPTVTTTTATNPAASTNPPPANPMLSAHHSSSSSSAGGTFKIPQSPQAHRNHNHNHNYNYNHNHSLQPGTHNRSEGHLPSMPTSPKQHLPQSAPPMRRGLSAQAFQRSHSDDRSTLAEDDFRL